MSSISKTDTDKNPVFLINTPPTKAPEQEEDTVSVLERSLQVSEDKTIKLVEEANLCLARLQLHDQKKLEAFQKMLASLYGEGIFTRIPPFLMLQHKCYLDIRHIQIFAVSVKNIVALHFEPKSGTRSEETTAFRTACQKLNNAFNLFFNAIKGIDYRDLILSKSKRINELKSILKDHFKAVKNAWSSLLDVLQDSGLETKKRQNLERNLDFLEAVCEDDNLFTLFVTPWHFESDVHAALHVSPHVLFTKHHTALLHYLRGSLDSMFLKFDQALKDLESKASENFSENLNHFKEVQKRYQEYITTVQSFSNGVLKRSQALQMWVGDPVYVKKLEAYQQLMQKVDITSPHFFIQISEIKTLGEDLQKYQQEVQQLFFTTKEHYPQDNQKIDQLSEELEKLLTSTKYRKYSKGILKQIKNIRHYLDQTLLFFSPIYCGDLNSYNLLLQSAASSSLFLQNFLTVTDQLIAAVKQRNGNTSRNIRLFSLIQRDLMDLFHPFTSQDKPIPFKMDQIFEIFGQLSLCFAILEEEKAPDLGVDDLQQEVVKKLGIYFKLCSLTREGNPLLQKENKEFIELFQRFLGHGLSASNVLYHVSLGTSGLSKETKEFYKSYLSKYHKYLAKIDWKATKECLNVFFQKLEQMLPKHTLDLYRQPKEDWLVLINQQEIACKALLTIIPDNLDIEQIEWTVKAVDKTHQFYFDLCINMPNRQDLFDFITESIQAVKNRSDEEAQEITRLYDDLIQALSQFQRCYYNFSYSISEIGYPFEEAQKPEKAQKPDSPPAIHPSTSVLEETPAQNLENSDLDSEDYESEIPDPSHHKEAFTSHTFQQTHTNILEIFVSFCQTQPQKLYSLSGEDPMEFFFRKKVFVSCQKNAQFYATLLQELSTCGVLSSQADMCALAFGGILFSELLLKSLLAQGSYVSASSKQSHPLFDTFDQHKKPLYASHDIPQIFDLLHPQFMGISPPPEESGFYLYQAMYPFLNKGEISAALIQAPSQIVKGGLQNLLTIALKTWYQTIGGQLLEEWELPFRTQKEEEQKKNEESVISKPLLPSLQKAQISDIDKGQMQYYQSIIEQIFSKQSLEAPLTQAFLLSHLSCLILEGAVSAYINTPLHHHEHDANPYIVEIQKKISLTSNEVEILQGLSRAVKNETRYPHTTSGTWSTRLCRIAMLVKRQQTLETGWDVHHRDGKAISTSKLHEELEIQYTYISQLSQSYLNLAGKILETL